MRPARSRTVLPDRATAPVVDDFQNPIRIGLTPVDQHFDGRTIPGDRPAQRGGDDFEFVVHLEAFDRVVIGKASTQSGFADR